MRADLALQTLQFAAAIRNLGINLLQRATLLRHLVFARIDLSPDSLFGFTEPRDLRVTAGKLSFQ